MNFKHFIKLLSWTFMLAALSLNTGCVVESISGSATKGSESDNGAGNGGEDQSGFVYDGCVDGQGVGTKRIQINFLFPDKATKVRIKRNGNQIAEFSKDNKVTSHIDDDGLREGATYLYTCEALIDGLFSEGKKTLQLSTLAVNAPTFNGIDTATVESANSVRVEWTPSVSDDPVSAFSYKIYANVGDEVDWTVPPRETVLQGSPASVLLSGLGDELSYAFGVRACSEGDICEVNTKKEVKVTTDGGAPTTVGASALNIENGVLKITAPWTETQGGVSKRYVYIRIGATGGTNLGDYTLQRTYNLSGTELFSPTSELEISPLQEGQTYHVIVQDEDPTGNRSAVSGFQSIDVTDVTPPSFGGITNLVRGTPADTVLTLSWTAIATEAVDPVNGGTKYKIYGLTDATPISTNSCLAGTELAELNVSDYTAGNSVNHDITGLQAKSYHSICIRAVDLAGNVSTNANFLQTNTLDITPPDFIGIQNIVFNNQTGSLELSWNASTATDMKEYRVTLWVNQPTEPAGATNLVKSHTDHSTGASIPSAEFSVSDGDTVYAKVEACDSTEPPFGTQNCSASGVIRNLVLPDVTPPPGFVGIKGPTEILTPAEGAFTVAWNAPADWSDYRGFKVYKVDPATNALSLMKTCPCADYGCSDQIVQCGVSGLDAYRTYRLHVRAYDDSNNETLYLDPSVSYSDKRTTDTTAPTFNSNLIVGASPTFELSWNAGVDNQYASEPGAEISYKVYQNNVPFDFSNPTQPNGNLKTSTTNLNFQDSGFVEAQTYHYTVCASDASGNTSCDQLQRSFTVPDVTKPVITKLATNKTLKSKVWELSWDMEDNISATADLFVEIRRKISVGGDLATKTDEVVYSGLGSTLVTTGNSASTTQPASLNPLSGPADLDRKINYLLIVRDQEGNEATDNITLESKNTLSITGVKSTSGPIAGGKLIAVYGSGFSNLSDNEVGESTTVTVAGNPCTSVKILSEEALYCTTPAVGVAGSVEVRVKTKVNKPAAPTNNVYSESALTNAYTYNASPAICDNPGSWGASFATGTGTILDPYILCDLSHLNSIRAISDSGAFFKMQNSIDLAGQSFDPLGNATKKFSGTFDGDGHLILNWTYNNAQANIGFLGYVNGDFQVTNLGIVDVNITASQSVGGIIGVVEGGVNKTGLLSKVFVTGTITADDFVGGVIGRKQNNHVNFNMIDSYFVGTLQINGITGYGGGIAGFLGSDDGGFFQNVYSEGSVNGTKVLGGLFGNLGEGKQLINSYSLANVTASGNTAGGLVGEAKAGALIDNSYSSGATISGVDNVGGLVGLLEGSLNNSHSKTTVTSTGRRAGGAVGYANVASIDNTYSELDLNLNNSAGGLVGELKDSGLTNSYALGSITSNGTDVGGLVGKVSLGASATKSILKSYAKGMLNTTASAVGGLIGTVETLSNATLTINEVFSNSQVGTDFALANQQYGGLIGKANTQSGSTVDIDNCYASGAVSAGNQVGGLVGGYDFTGGALNIEFCYSSSPVPGNTSGRGGVFGKSSNTLHTIANSYWDTETATKVFASGDGAFNGTVTGKTTAEMQDYQNSIYTGWDFTNIWLQPTSGYPVLKFANP